MPFNWMMRIELHGYSFDHLKELLSLTHAHVRDARNYREAGIAVGGDGGGWSVIVDSPIEERIKALRAEADALEAEAGAAPQK